MAYDEFLSRHAAACHSLGVHVAVLIVVTQFLLPTATQILVSSVIGVKVDGELTHFSSKVEIGFMLRRISVTTDATVLQAVVRTAISQQVVSIIIVGFHIIVGVLIEAAEGIAVVQLVVESGTSFKIRVALRGLMMVGDGP